MQKDQKFSWEAFNKAPVVGILRGVDAATVQHLAAVYAEVGFSALEITMNTPGATGLITLLRQTFPQLNIGAGTVCSMEDLEAAVAAGSQFIVTPIVNKEVIEKCAALGIPSFVGALTPSEIYQAWSWGATVVKVFPCSKFGSGYVKDVLAPLSQMKLLPTGGVIKDNIGDFMKVGAVGVGMGGSLFPNDLMPVTQREALKKHLEHIYSLVS